MSLLYQTAAQSVALAMTAAQQGQEQMEKIGAAIASRAANDIFPT